MGCFFVWRVKKFILICCVFQSHGSIHCIHYNRFGFEPTNMPSQPLRVAVLHRFGFAAKIDKQLSIFLRVFQPTVVSHFVRYITFGSAPMNDTQVSFI